jgi:hypothetical protein
MADKAPDWVDPAMRVGYAARGIVYIIVGAIAVMAAWQGGQAEGTQGALARIQDEWWGWVLLILIALGFVCYAFWKALDAWMDLNDKGTGAKGIVARVAMVITAIIHLGLAFYAGSLLFGGSGSSGGGQGGSGGGTQSMTATLMAQPFGQWLVGLVGACVIGAGVFHFVKALREKYKEHMARTPGSESLDFLVKFGLIAHGVTLGVIGGMFIWAAWTYDPSQAGGLQQALQIIREAAFGRILLGLVGLGLVAFAAYCFVEARYRIVPRVAGSDVVTLASRGAEAAERATAAARRNLS